MKRFGINNDDFAEVLERNGIKQINIGGNEELLQCQTKRSNIMLCKLIQEGDQQAKQELCIKYQGLVRKYAYAYYKVYGNDLPIEDLEQMGYLGLLIAAVKFDFSYHNTFSTYAKFWIMQNISRGVACGFIIRLPLYLLKDIVRCSGLYNYCEQKELDHRKRIEVIANRMGIETSKVEELLSLRKRYMNLAPLNVPAGEDQIYELEELLEDTQQIPIEEQVVDSALIAEVEKVLSTLTDREERVIRLRFGIGGEDEHTLEQIGEILHLTRERVRQIENEAMRKMRNPNRSKSLRAFYRSIKG